MGQGENAEVDFRVVSCSTTIRAQCVRRCVQQGCKRKLECMREGGSSRRDAKAGIILATLDARCENSRYARIPEFH